jgi:pyruvate,water dikinase
MSAARSATLDCCPEYHIPAVLGTGVATERIANTQQIAVDGDAAMVLLKTS